MGSHRLVHRPLVVAAALGVALIGLPGVAARPAAAQTCPPPATGFISSAPATAARTVALTFDDGPGPFLPQVLKVLRENNVRATFFDTGAHDATWPAMTRQIGSDGTLWEYAGNGTGGWAGQFAIGGGWNALTLIAGVG